MNNYVKRMHYNFRFYYKYKIIEKLKQVYEE